MIQITIQDHAQLRSQYLYMRRIQLKAVVLTLNMLKYSWDEFLSAFLCESQI